MSRTGVVHGLDQTLCARIRPWDPELCPPCPTHRRLGSGGLAPPPPTLHMLGLDPGGLVLPPTHWDWTLGPGTAPWRLFTLGLGPGIQRCPHPTLHAEIGHLIQKLLFLIFLKHSGNGSGNLVATAPPLPNFWTWEELHGLDDMTPWAESGPWAGG